MQSIWNGAISFGLVNIPVKVYSATENKDISFHLFHNACKSPIKYIRRCPVCNREVNAEEIIKGYEFIKGQYVFFEEEELNSLGLPSLRTIEITEFIDLAEVDPVYFSRAYYLVPREEGQKAYALLQQAMADTGKIGLAKITLRQRESLAALRVFEKALLMQLMAYADEIRHPSMMPELGYTAHLEQKEQEMAVLLINGLSAPFEPEKYQDRYRADLKGIIEKKVAGQEVEAPHQLQPAKVVDLMEALKASIEQTETKRKPSPKTRKKAKGA